MGSQVTAQPGSDAWRAQLQRDDVASFRFESRAGSFTARRELKSDRAYWYGYRKVRGRLRKAYLGRTDDLTAARLDAVAAQLASSEAPPLVSSHDLPTPPTALLGRDRELARVQDRLLDASVRLLTLTGTGGTGKTRLAIAAAHALRPHFGDGVWFVDLSGITDSSLVVREIAHRLGVLDTGERPVRERLHEYLAAKSALLILDNFEQVLPAAAEMAALLDSCAQLKLIATSREPLHLRAEHQFSVPPLAREPALELFMQRAAAAGADAVSASDVAELVERLDGLPLAIELAAARARLITPRAMLVRLERQLDLLRSTEVDRPLRHQSVRATVSWSFDLLSNNEQRAFCRLGVFAGGCSLAAAEAVLDDLPAPLELLASLIDKSLARTEPIAGGDVRLRMLETIRSFALDKLASSGDDELARQRHALFLLEQFKPESWEVLDLPTPEELAQLEAEHDNVRAALRWCIDAGRVDTALELATSIHVLWIVGGYLREGLRWFEETLALAHDADPLLAARARHGAGQLAWRQGDYEQAEAHYAAGLALRRQIGDPFGVAVALQGLASVARDRGETARAVQLWQECLAVFQAAGHRARTARAMLNLAIAQYLAGQSAPAEALLRQTITLSRTIGQYWALASANSYLGLLALELHGDTQVARECALEAIATLDRVNDSWVTAHVLALAGFLAGSSEVCARLLGASAGVREQMGARLHPAFTTAHARCQARCIEQIGMPAFEHMFSEGHSQPIEDVLRVARESLRTSPSPGPTSTAPAASALSDREREVAVLVAEGLTSREIAQRLVIGERTIETHVDHIRAKLGVRSRAQIAAWAVEAGLATRR